MKLSLDQCKVGDRVQLYATIRHIMQGPNGHDRFIWATLVSLDSTKALLAWKHGDGDAPDSASRASDNSFSNYATTLQGYQRAQIVRHDLMINAVQPLTPPNGGSYTDKLSQCQVGEVIGVHLNSSRHVSSIITANVLPSTVVRIGGEYLIAWKDGERVPQNAHSIEQFADPPNVSALVGYSHGYLTPTDLTVVRYHPKAAVPATQPPVATSPVAPTPTFDRSAYDNIPPGQARYVFR